jgi:hypothetical protein
MSQIHSVRRSDANEGICWNGLMDLRMILEGPLGDEGIATAKELLTKAEWDSDQRLRERAKEIRHRLRSDPNPVETSVVKPANRAIRRRGTQLNSFLAQKIKVGVTARAGIDDGRKVERKIGGVRVIQLRIGEWDL